MLYTIEHPLQPCSGPQVWKYTPTQVLLKETVGPRMGERLGERHSGPGNSPVLRNLGSHCCSESNWLCPAGANWDTSFWARSKEDLGAAEEGQKVGACLSDDRKKCQETLVVRIRGKSQR